MQELITNNTFGYNYDTGSTPIDKAIRHGIASKATFHTIMVNPHNDFPLPSAANIAWQFYESLKDTVDDLILLIRFYSKLEGNWNTYPDRTRWANALKQIQLPPNSFIDSRCNEPNINGSNAQTNKDYVKWEIENLKAVSNAGHRYAVGAFSTGTPHESLIYSVYDDLWRAVDDYNGAIDMHLYGVFPLEAGETHPYELALNPTAIRDVFDNPKRWQNYFGWLTGRVFQVEEAYEEVNGEKPLILVAESLLDRVMPDPYNSQWKSKFGMPQYQYDNRGLMSWERVMKETFPELSFTQAIEKFLIHVRENVLYGDNIRMALFGHNPLWNNYDWSTHKWSGHDVSDPSLTEFHDFGLARVNTYPVYIDSEEPIPMPNDYDSYDVPMAEFIVFTTLDKWNIREEPSTDSADIGDMPKKAENVLRSVNPIPTNDAKYDWYKLKVGDIKGFVAQYKGGSTPNIFTRIIEPDPIPETDDDFVKALEARIDAQDILIDALTTQIAELLEEKVIDFPVGDISFTAYKFQLPMIASVARGFGYALSELDKNARRADGDLLLEDVNEEVFQAATVAHTDDSDVFSNFSDLPEDIEPSIMPELHSEDEDSAA